MKNKYYLVAVTQDDVIHKFIMLNAYQPITNRQCNSMIFENKADANLDVSVFDYFNCKLIVLNEGKPLDRRTKEFKQLRNNFSYFSVDLLPYFNKL